ncbi:hypothetical protein PILCRDRAFT_555954 [Piloderma croceum F 1598]|uniref:PPPDE domain-containing protein n=1 Tax=Piloderma croceum (strain F 1598) TaxID=765440 RepID=A0A0C3BQ21_PILCF|nr:hypothetical protein PILCRDRAFT_555954 [Piloderma croceum F 1598]
MHVSERFARVLFCLYSAGRSIMATIRSPPPNPSFLPDSRGWTTDLWAKEVLGPENLELTRKSRVVRIAHRKVLRHVQHEYVDVAFRVGDATAWVRVERNGTPARGVPQETIPDARDSRNANDNNDTPASNQVLLTSTPNRGASSTSLTSVLSTSSSGSSSATAHDTVHLLLFRKGIDISLPLAKEPDDREINTMELSGNRELSVTEFAVLLQSISKKAPKYDVIFKNCYWYAGAVCDCVCREYPYTLKRDRRRSTIHSFPLGAKLTPNSAFDELYRAWRAEVTTLENLKTKQEIDDEREKEAMKKLDAAVDAAVKEEERKRDEVVEAAVKEERRKRDEAVEAERRKRDEAEHKLKDLEEQLKRLQAT